MRHNERKNDELRPIRFTCDYVRRLPGSVLVEQGETRVVCTATIEERVPPFLKNSGKGWITAEYSMLPGSCGNQRIARERLRIHNRHGEIQRFVGRALRSVIDPAAIKDKTINLDADVIQADGGTRCASLNGCLLALILALRHLVYEQIIADFPRLRLISAVSLGLVRGEILADLDYGEDSQADMDLNLVSDEARGVIEVQAFCENGPPPAAERFQEMVGLGLGKNIEIMRQMRETLAAAGLAALFTRPDRA